MKLCLIIKHMSNVAVMMLHLQLYVWKKNWNESTTVAQSVKRLATRLDDRGGRGSSPG
jgi:hypothetical protein